MKRMPDTDDYVGESFGEGDHDPSEDASPSLFDEGTDEVIDDTGEGEV